MRVVVLSLIVVVVLTTLGARAFSGLELRGPLSANETEMQEGYFAIAQDTVIMVRPGSEMHQWLKRHAGQTVRLVIEPVTTQ